MDYFVGIENTPYYQWQIELLIESFKRQECQDNLFVALAEYDSPNFDLTRNLPVHQRVYRHENIGSIRGFAPLNGLMALAFSLQQQLVRQPVVVMPSDVVLFRQPEFQPHKFPEVIFAPNPFFTLDYATEKVGPFWEWLGKERKEFESGWVPLGSLMILSQVPLEIIYEVIPLTELLATHQLLLEKPIFQDTHLLAWTILLMKYYKNIRIFGDYFLVMPVAGSGNSSFISYEQGISSAFQKSMFRYPPPNYTALGNPFQVLAVNYPSPNAYYLSQLARKHLDSVPA